MSRPVQRRERGPTLGGVITIWLIFAPAALIAATAMFSWIRKNFVKFNALYAIFLAVFFAGLFFFLLFGVVHRYFRDRRAEHDGQDRTCSEESVFANREAGQDPQD